ncbi:MAG TPA: DNA polymerase III subunit gamma/tau [Gemmatimonadales bacterium]|nr:DNA polymerase III subunit gamma/tau [Gemmatimonadales bacterium]
MALALARKYRPRTFSDLLVQDHVAQVLRGAVSSGRVGHGYLLTGPRGVGKTTAARILAMALNCERKAAAPVPGEPCGECATCLRIWNGAANLDVVEIDAASNRGVDDARELRERAMYAASEAEHYKVYIVDEAHMLTREAWNALLKILEEPPPRVVFVFATTEPQKIANTAAPVLSRLQRFDFRRIGPAAIRERLQHVARAEGLEVEDDALRIIARYADGGMRDALSVLDQALSFGEGPVTAERVRDILGLVADDLHAEVLGLVADRAPERVFPLVARLVDAGADLGEFLAGAAEALRALLMLQLGAEPEGITDALRQALAGYADRLSSGDLLRMLKIVADQEGNVRRSGNPRLVVETTLLRWAMMDRTVDLERVLAPGGGAPAAPPATRAAPARPVPSSAPAASAPPAPAVPGSVPAPDPVTSAPFSLDGVRSVWDEVVEAAGREKKMLGIALAATRPVSAEPPVVTLELTEENPMHAEALERLRGSVQSLLGARLGSAVTIQVQPPKGGGAPSRPKRMTEAGNRAERLSKLRGKDPALDAAASELDLEVLE